MGIFAIYPLLKTRRVSITVPSGLIVLYNGTSAPDGWTLFTSADGKYPVGAGSTYAVGATGGSTSITTNASDSQGSHNGSASFTNNAGTPFETGKSAAGAHTHTLSFNYEPPFYTLRLIKADSELPQLPANGVVLSASTLSGLTEFTTPEGKILKVAATIGSGGNNTIPAGTSSSIGEHHHGTTDCGSNIGSSTCASESSGMTHTHPTTSFVITPAIKRALMSAWYDANNAYNLQGGMYAFYQSITPPDGWYLCNGSNGTVDLRDYFIEFTDTSDDGTRTGDNTISLASCTLSSVDWNHSHKSTTFDDSLALPDQWHASQNATHSHTIAALSGKSYVPPYYALAIIMKAA